MKKKCIVFFIQFVMVLLFASSVNAAEWRCPFGLTYINGFEDTFDIYEKNLEAKGYLVDTELFVPVGLSVQPYLLFNNGLGIGFGLGPVMFIWSTEADFFAVPVNLDLRYIFFSKAPIAPYVRVGGRYHIANGDYVESSSVGAFGGIGIEFARKHSKGWGIEIAYDTSEIEMKKYRSKTAYNLEKVEPSAMMASIFFVF